MVTTVRLILQLLTRRQKRGVTLLIVAMVLLNFLDLAALVFIGLLITQLTGGSAGELEGVFSGIDDNLLVAYLLGGAGLLFTTKTVLGVALARTRARFMARVELHFSKRIAAQVFCGGLEGVKRHARQDIEWAILRSSHTAFGKILGDLLALTAELSLSLSVFVLFLVVDPMAALGVAVYFSIVLALFEKFTRSKVSRTGAAYARGSLLVTQTIGDFLVAFKEISVLRKFDFFLGRIEQGRREVAHGHATMSYVTAVPRLIVELALILGAMGFFGLQFLMDGGPDLVVLGVFLVGSLRIMSALLPLQRAAMTLRHEIPQAEGAIALLSETWDDRVELSQLLGSDAHSVPSTGANRTGLSVDIEAVRFTYPDSPSAAEVLGGVSMAIPAGSTVALIGPSGAGKSTLVDIILGLLEPSSGKILYSGRSPRAIQAHNPGIMGYVPQKPRLISGTVRENVALGVEASDIDDDRVWSALESAEVADFVRSLDRGLSSAVGEQADALSGGQMQRFGLARALYSDPRLLVLDEATSSLDADTEHSISRSLASLGTKMTKIIVAHRLSTVQTADVVFVMSAGKVVDQGTLDELLATNPLVRRYAKLMKVGF